MSRTRTLSYVLWSAMAATAPACGGDDGVKHLADAPPPGGQPVAQFSSSLAFETTCGDAMAATADVVITNAGTGSLVISAADITTGFTVATTLPLTIAAGGHASLTIRPPNAVVGTDLAGMAKSGQLTLTTNETAPQASTVALNVTVHGANLAFTDSASAPLTLAFSSNSGCPAPQAVFLRNTGDTALTVVGNPSASGYTFGGFSGGPLGPGEFGQQQVRPFQLTGACQSTEEITYNVTGTNLCTPTTQTLTATFNMQGSSSCFCS